MSRTRVPPKVARSTKLQGAQRSPELTFRNTDFRVPEILTFPALKIVVFWENGIVLHPGGSVT